MHICCTFCGSDKHNIEACPHTHSGSAARAWHPGTVQDDFVLD